MPTKQTARLSVEDSLIRLIDLPPAERNHVLRVFARELTAAEARVLRTDQAAYDAAHPVGTPGSVLKRPPVARRSGDRASRLTC